jgi:hypothetical protein
MKMTKWILAALMTATLAVAGCSKAPTIPDEIDINGVKVAMPKLQRVVGASKDAEVQNSIGKLNFGFRYRDFAAVQAELAKLAANPALTDEQKKIVAQVDEQLKQALSKPPAAPKQ